MEQGKKYVIKGKRPDGKSWIVGNAKLGNYGPRLGLRKTPELVAMFDAVEDGGFLNLDVYEDDGDKAQPRARQQARPQPGFTDDDDGTGLPF